MHIQTPVKYHLAQVRMAFTKKTEMTRAGEDVEEKGFSHTLDGNVN